MYGSVYIYIFFSFQFMWLGWFLINDDEYIQNNMLVDRLFVFNIGVQVNINYDYNLRWIQRVLLNILLGLDFQQVSRLSGGGSVQG